MGDKLKTGRSQQLYSWLLDYYENNGRKMRGAEIGVFRASTSYELLSAFPGLTLYMIDPWKAPEPETPLWQSSTWYHKADQNKFDAWYRNVVRRVERFGDRAIIIRAPSIDGMSRIEDRSLDFVFIDGDHTEEGCGIDIDTSLPKVKKGGYIFGHDYNSPRHPGVLHAFNKRFKKRQKGLSKTIRVQI
jgi:hypothetical protein